MIPQEPHEQQEEERDLSTWIYLLIILGAFGLLSSALIYGLEFVLSCLVVI